MPSRDQIAGLRRKIEEELSDVLRFEAESMHLPANDLLTLRLNNGATIMVARCDQSNILIVSNPERIPGGKFEVSAEPTPGKPFHTVKLTKLVCTQGAYQCIQGQAVISTISPGRGHPDIRSETYTFDLKRCKLTFDVIEHLACAL